MRQEGRRGEGFHSFFPRGSTVSGRHLNIVPPLFAVTTAVEYPKVTVPPSAVAKPFAYSLSNFWQSAMVSVESNGDQPTSGSDLVIVHSTHAHPALTSEAMKMDRTAMRIMRGFIHLLFSNLCRKGLWGYRANKGSPLRKDC